MSERITQWRIGATFWKVSQPYCITLKNSGYKGKATAVRPVQQKFICLVKDRHGIFYNEKKCKDKDLIWHMVGEMVKK